MDHGSELTLDDLFGLARFSLRKRFTDADDGRDAVAQRRSRLRSNLLVRFAMVLTTLRMTDDDVTHAEFLQHRGRLLAGESALRLGRYILRTQGDRRTGNQRLNLCQIRRRHAYRDVAAGEATPASNAFTSASLAARLPFIFQLPAISFFFFISLLLTRSARSCRCAGWIPSGCAPARHRSVRRGSKLLWMTGLTAPLSSNGHTFSRNALAIAPLKAIGRGRSVDPVMVSRLRSTRPALISLLTPPCTAMITAGHPRPGTRSRAPRSAGRPCRAPRRRPFRRSGA